MIPVSAPSIGEEELQNVVDCIKRGAISGTVEGDYIEEFESSVCQQCGRKYGVATSSGTTALALAVASVGIKPGDEVIVSTFTNIATAFASVYVGARPIFVDSEALTWNIDPHKIEGKITSATKADRLKINLEAVGRHDEGYIQRPSHPPLPVQDIPDEVNLYILPPDDIPVDDVAFVSVLGQGLSAEHTAPYRGGYRLLSEDKLLTLTNVAKFSEVWKFIQVRCDDCPGGGI